MTTFLVANPTGQGALWGTETEDLNATVVSWPEGTGVAAHTNDLVDVVMIVLAGQGTVRVGDDTEALAPGTVVSIPKRFEREIWATAGTLTYVNVHKRKPKMQPNMVRPR